MLMSSLEPLDNMANIMDIALLIKKLSKQLKQWNLNQPLKHNQQLKLIQMIIHWMKMIPMMLIVILLISKHLRHNLH